ncbi:MAG: hypothetical protein JW829_05175 [Pirellulales bacterium]|nr:hypothetical protein [Pirellulales bacterium]
MENAWERTESTERTENERLRSLRALLFHCSCGGARLFNKMDGYAVANRFEVRYITGTQDEVSIRTTIHVGSRSVKAAPYSERELAFR